MPFLIKKGGAYAAPVAVSVKKNGVYTAVVGVFAKVGGAYQSVMGAAAAPVLRIAALDNRIATGSISSAGKTDYILRFPFALAKDNSAIVLNFGNFWTIAGGALANSNAMTIQSVCIDDGTGFAQGKFAGANTLTLATTDSDKNTDSITAASVGLPKFAKEVTYWMKVHISVPVAGNLIPYCPYFAADYAGSSFMWFDPATTTLTGEVGPGAYTLTGGTPVAASPGYVPIVLGYSEADSHNAIGWGDSIMYSQGDTSLKTGGFFNRAARSGAQKFALLNCGRQSITAGTLSGANGAKLREYFKYARTVVSEPGTNDCGAAGTTATLTALQNVTNSTWASMRAAGVVNIIQIGLFPRAGSTSDAWTTEAGQTIPAGWQTGGIPDQYNAWLATKAADLTINAYLRPPSIRGVNTDAWSVVGGANTIDGTHPSAVAHIAAAGDLAPVLYAHT